MKKLLTFALVVSLVAACLSGTVFAIGPEASWTDGVIVKEGTLAEMNSYAWKEGGTITLLQDVYALDRGDGRYTCSFDASGVLDLNGHKLGAPGGGVMQAANCKELTIKDSVGGGVIYGGLNPAVRVNGGIVHLENVTLYSQDSDALYMPKNPLVGNTITGCTLISASKAAVQFPTSPEMVLTVKNSILASGSTVPALNTLLPPNAEDPNAKVEGHYQVENTLFCTVDGTAAVCADADLEGQKAEPLADVKTLELKATKLDVKMENLKAWGDAASPYAPIEVTPPATPEAPVEPEAPADPAIPILPEPPASPELPAEPEIPTQPEAPEEPGVPAEPESPAEDGGFPVGTVAAAAGIVVLLAVVIFAFRKKK